MKPLQTILLLAVTIPITFAQQPVRPGHKVPTGREAGGVQFGSRRQAKPRVAAVPHAIAPAAGVVQCRFEEGRVDAYFIATGSIPSSASLAVTLTIDDGSGNPSSIQFDPISGPFNPADYITLPSLDNMGDLQPSLLVTYTVDVTVGRTTTEANGSFLVGATLAYGDVTNLSNAPIMTGTSQRIASNKDMILVINGTFTSDSPLVVLEGTVVPSNAITVVSGSEIDVDLSQTPGLDLTGLFEYLLTVSQAGFADTLVYRYVPAAPNTFNLAPQ